MVIDNRDTKCSVTVMPVLYNRIGFLRRDLDDSFAGLLIAPGGTVETTDGETIDGVLYHSVEVGAIREMWEKTGIRVSRRQLHYFCSLTLPDGRVVVSMYAELNVAQITGGYGYLEFFTIEDIQGRSDFAPGMKEEAMLLADKLRSEKQWL